MIYPKELRIGNLVMDYAGRIVTVDGIFLDDEYDMYFILVKESESMYLSDEIHPVPITSERLERAGFVLFPWGWVRDNVLLRHSKGKYWVEVGNGLRAYANHAHRLQNLFFALTCKELEFKPENVKG